MDLRQTSPSAARAGRQTPETVISAQRKTAPNADAVHQLNNLSGADQAVACT
jgi:hypothetical protein